MHSIAAANFHLTPHPYPSDYRVSQQQFKLLTNRIESCTAKNIPGTVNFKLVTEPARLLFHTSIILLCSTLLYTVLPLLVWMK